MLVFLLEFGVSSKISCELVLLLDPFMWRGLELPVERVSEHTMIVRQYRLPNEVV